MRKPILQAFIGVSCNFENINFNNIQLQQVQIQKSIMDNTHFNNTSIKDLSIKNCSSITKISLAFADIPEKVIAVINISGTIHIKLRYIPPITVNLVN